MGNSSPVWRVAAGGVLGFMKGDAHFISLHFVVRCPSRSALVLCKFSIFSAS